MPKNEEQISSDQEREQAPASPPEPTEDRAVRPYDFRRPRHLSAEQVRNLQRLHSVAAEKIQQRLSRYLGVQFDVKLHGTEELDYGVFAEGCKDPLSVNVLDLSPIAERGLLILDAALCLAFVDRVLGGLCKAPSAPRPLTAIDQAATESAIEAVLYCLRESWKELYPLKMTVVERKNDAKYVQIVARGEPVLIVTLKVSGEPGEGNVRLVLPLGGLKSATDATARASALPPSAEKAAKVRETVMRALERAALPAMARVGSTDLPLRNLASLRIGDILRLDQVADSPAVLSIGGKPAFLGRMGLRGRRKALQIASRIGSDEEE